MTLRARLVERIGREGPLPFDAYMEAALHDLDGGFYARGPAIGQGGHFATAPEAHPAFADAVAAEAIATWEGLGRPEGFRLVEAGPGSGRLARDVAERLEAAGVPFALALVERSAGLRERQREALGDRPVVWVEDAAVLEPAPGFLYANELVDALPVRLLAWPDEVLVGAGADGRLVEVTAPAAPDLVAAATMAVPAPRAGARYALRLGVGELLAGLAGALSAGRILLVDYGGPASEVHDGRRPPVRTYIGGQPGGDPLAAPGTQDLTADVDVDDLTRAAEALGLHGIRVETQAAWLARHGAVVPEAAERDEADWALAGLVDERLPFFAWSARVARGSGGCQRGPTPLTTIT
jgi:NADH dehydrogenase [ubiquinone] 1 alpha subcomplex assembly factor 7